MNGIRDIAIIAFTALYCWFVSSKAFASYVRANGWHDDTVTHYTLTQTVGLIVGVALGVWITSSLRKAD